MTITDDRLDATTPTSASTSGSSTMRVRKRNGDSEAVDVNKIVRAVQRCADGLDGVEPLRIATRTIAFAELPQAFDAYIKGTVTGRTVVKIGSGA